MNLSRTYLPGMIVGLVNPYLQDKDHGNLGGRVAFICKHTSPESAHSSQMAHLESLELFSFTSLSPN